MSNLACFVAGLLAFPALRVVIMAVGIGGRAVRDTVKWRFHHLKPGYSRWHMVWLYPMLFKDNVVNQAGAWWHGTESEITPAAAGYKEQS